jgi:predicted ATPase
MKYPKTINDLIPLYKLISKKEETITIDNKVKNIIINSCTSYTLDIQSISTAEDNEISDYNTNKSRFANDIINTIILNSKKVNDVILPRVISGESSKRSNGYVFSKETYYNKMDVIDKFYEIMFTKNYRDLTKLKSIHTKVELVKAINGCSDANKINSTWTDNFNKFCKWAKEEIKYIKEDSSDDSIGNTLGEMSLVYYKFQTSVENKCDVLMIDQPEDNISNNRISEKLITYLDSVRRNRQLIIVTHNPLLVVNLDVDNVIHLTKTNKFIDIKAGCLEDEDNGIIELVAKTLDGGKDMIEKRLKIYG